MQICYVRVQRPAIKKKDANDVLLFLQSIFKLRKVPNQFISILSNSLARIIFTFKQHFAQRKIGAAQTNFNTFIDIIIQELSLFVKGFGFYILNICKFFVRILT